VSFRSIAAPAILLVVLLLLSACAGGQNAVPGKVKGDRSFAKGDYNAAIEHYRLYLESEFGAADVSDAQFMMARSYYEAQEYPSAALEFEIYRRNYPRSDSLEAAGYYEALCYWQQSPQYDRDATPTLQAIRKLEDYLLDFPGGVHEEDARAKLFVLREKLALKTLSTARFYQRLKRLDAAALYYEKLLREHPDSALLGEALEDFEGLRRQQGREAEAEELAGMRRNWRPPGGAP